MPKTVIDLPYQVASLSILDATGQLDKDLEPDIPDDLLLRLHRTMLLGRRFDERMLNLQRQGRIGTFAPPHSATRRRPQLAGGSSHAPRAAPPPHRNAPAPGAARLSLVLDRRLRMGESS